MFLELKACYSPSDLVFVVALFILTLSATCSFVFLLSHLIRGVFQEVRLIKSNKNEN